MSTLYSSVIKLTNLLPVTIPPPGGQHAHAAFLDILRAVDPALSQALHDLNGRKPFTVSPLMGLPKNRQRQESSDSRVVLREGWEASASLADSLKDHVKERLASYSYPREISFVDALPMTVTGKVIRKDLKARAAAEGLQ